jgi:hypothetical protein
MPMKVLDDPKIPTAIQNPRRPHHSHKSLDVSAEMGLKPRRPYCTKRRHHYLNAAPTNLNPKNEEWSPQNRGRSPPTDEGRDTRHLHGPKTTEMRRSAAPAGCRNSDAIAWSPGVAWSDVMFRNVNPPKAGLITHKYKIIFGSVRWKL